MTVTVNRKELKSALARAAKARERSCYNKTSLTQVHLEGREGQLQISCMSNDIAITTTIPAATGDSEWTVLVPYSGLANLVGRGGKRVHIEVDDRGIRVRRDKLTLDVSNLVAVETFPDLPHVQTQTHQLAPSLIDGLASLMSVASTDEARPVLTVVSLQRDVAAATDSYRLLVHPGNWGVEALVPAKLIKMIAAAKPKSLSVSVGSFEDVAYGVKERVTFRSPDTTWTARIIEGVFPDFTQLVPEPSERPVGLVADRAELIATLIELKGVMSNGNNGEPLVKITPDGALVDLEVDVDHATAAKVHQWVAADVEGEVQPWYMNLPQFISTLGTLTGSMVTIRPYPDPGPGKPVLITASDDPRTVVAMPVRA